MKAHHRGGNQSPLIHRYTNRNRRRSCNPNRDRHVHVVSLYFSLQNPLLLALFSFFFLQIYQLLNCWPVSNQQLHN